MKVLATLLAQPGRMFSRSELFEAVWPNQIVSDDALTRCVSDIRGQLRRLSGRDEWIETLPKRGYRWIGPVGEAVPVDVGPSPSPTQRFEAPPATEPPVAPVPSASVSSPPPHRVRHPLLWLAGRGAAYLVALVLMASVALWAIDRFSGQRFPIVALLPVTTETSRTAVALEFDRALRTWLGRQEQIQMLALAAIDTRPANPFPYFHYEFGARWLVEAGLHEFPGQTVVSVAVVDARTGIVEMQYSERAPAGTPDEQLFSEDARTALREFFDLQLAR
ncbi:MAG: winged helix-turn-helix domain-containing protein [Pseudomonadota bacterium]|nr:winged helix-turn-helix domain-containing protein [Pseudomonadota bacterium]